jgi:hypothetical protein
MRHRRRITGSRCAIRAIRATSNQERCLQFAYTIASKSQMAQKSSGKRSTRVIAKIASVSTSPSLGINLCSETDLMESRLPAPLTQRSGL